jgi:ribosomal protein S10
MDWKLELDALIESTMAFVKDIKPQSISDTPLVVRTAEKSLADTSKPIPLPAANTLMPRPTSERDEILQRVSNFRAHQKKMALEREDYYLRTKAKMLAAIDPNPASGKNLATFAAKYEVGGSQ